MLFLCRIHGGLFDQLTDIDANRRQFFLICFSHSFFFFFHFVYLFIRRSMFCDAQQKKKCVSSLIVSYRMSNAKQNKEKNEIETLADAKGQA